MNPHDALWQQQLLRDNLTKPYYREFLQYFSEDVHRKKAAALIVDSKGRPSGSAMADNQIRILERAETYYVSADMCDIMVMASRGLDGLDRFSHDLWPTDDGFLLFQKSLLSTDVWGKTVATKALVWERKSFKSNPGTLVTLYSDLDDPNDWPAAEMTQQKRDDTAAAMGRLQTSQTIWISDDMRVGPEENPVRQDYGDESDREFLGREYTLGVKATNTGRPILALLMLLNQTIVDLEHHDLRPANPKRARKMRVPGKITVITLRKTKGFVKQEGESHIEWQHRWIVRAYWRSQVCGPHYPLAQEIRPGVFRARIYIAPFVKGPPGAPFMQTTKIYSLKR
jgi:hypothetical protein